MAHSISSRKRVRQNVKRRAINRARRTVLKSKSRGAATLVEATSAPANADTTLRELTKVLDRAAAQGTIHKNAASRRKSRLARRLNALKRGTPKPG